MDTSLFTIIISEYGQSSHVNRDLDLWASDIAHACNMLSWYGNYLCLIILKSHHEQQIWYQYSIFGAGVARGKNNIFSTEE